MIVPPPAPFFLVAAQALRTSLILIKKWNTLECLYISGSGTRESLSSRCTSLERNFLDSIYKFQNVQVLSFSTNLPRPSCNSFDGRIGYSFLQLIELNLFGENVTELDFLEFDYFPALTRLHLRNSSTITIPKSFIKFTTLSLQVHHHPHHSSYFSSS